MSSKIQNPVSVQPISRGSLSIKALFVMALTLVMTNSAFAQITKVNTVMANVASVLTGVSVLIFTITIMWAGFKLAWQHAKWSDISNIVIGGILVGGAAGIASWLIN